MSERAFSDLTKTVDSEPGQSPVLGDGDTVDYDVNLTAFRAPYDVIVQAPAGANPPTVGIYSLGLNNVETELVAPAAITMNAKQINTITEEHNRLRIKVAAGTPAPTVRILVQVNASRN